MVAFNRIGATNAAHHVGMLQRILREEWGYTGVISTDMMNNAYYFVPESMIMAGITQVGIDLKALILLCRRSILIS